MNDLINYFLILAMFVFGGGGLVCIGFAIFGKTKDKGKPFLKQKI